MPKNCLLPSQAEKLKRAFREGEISFTKLYEMTSDGRLEYFTDFLGSDNAKVFTAKLEKAFLAPRQKDALKKIASEIAQRGKLYTGIKMEESKAMRNELSISDLEKLSSNDRLDLFNNYIDDKKAAKRLNKSFEYHMVKGDLSNWQERAFGDDTLTKQKMLKGNMQRIEMLEKMGVLNPAQMETFMKNYAEDMLGVSLSLEDSQKLSELTRKEMEIWDKLVASGDFNSYNKNLVDYLNAVKDIGLFEKELVGKNGADFINAMINYSRGSILGSPRSLRNSALYQIVPTIERAAYTAISSPALFNKELEANVVDIFKAKASASKKTKEMFKFMGQQVKNGFKIYKETDFEMSRMTTLDDGRNFFGGEKIGKQTLTPYEIAIERKFGKRFKKAITSNNKIKNTIFVWVDAVINAPKWTAGFTDMLLGNTIRAASSLHNSHQIAYLEASRKEFKNKQEKKDWIENRASEILFDSWSFDPKSNQSKIVRSQAVLDAHLTNQTQDSFSAEKTEELRGIFDGKKIKAGKLFLPFIRIASTVTQKGLEATFLPVTAVYRINEMRKASNISDSVKRTEEMQRQFAHLAGSFGFLGAAMLLSIFIDDDDYVEPYSSMQRKDYKLAEAQEINPGSVRLFGKWIDLKYIPMINIPLTAILQGRRNYNNRKDPDKVVASFLRYYIGGAMSGVATSIANYPGIDFIVDLTKKVEAGQRSSDTEKMITNIGFNGEALLNWAKIRAIPSVVSYDLWNQLIPKDAKYDFLGNKITREKDLFGMRKDRTNDIIIEFARLKNNGFMPTVSDPTTEGAKNYKEKNGEKAYQDFLAQLKKDYADKIEEYLDSNWYLSKSNEERMKAINKLREKYILKPLEEYK